MKSIVHHLRKRPDHHKKAIAFSVSFFVTAAIFGVWFSTQTFFNTPTVIVEAETVNSPIDTFMGTVASSWNGFIGLFK